MCSQAILDQMQTLPRIVASRGEIAAKKIRDESSYLRFAELHRAEVETHAQDDAMLSTACSKWASRPFRTVSAMMIPAAAAKKCGGCKKSKKGGFSPLAMAQCE